jgi:quercetin dioxygenase-like cupin family protein
MQVNEHIKKFPAIIAMMIITISSCCQPAVYNQNNAANLNDTLFPKGNKISNNNFAGTAWLSWLSPNDSIFNCPIGNVTFEPGARTNWHKHPGGQILLVTEGKGYYQERGKQAQMIKKGDVVHIGPDVEHWHGATAESGLIHIAINTNIQAGSVVWLQPVSDEEYKNLK